LFVALFAHGDEAKGIAGNVLQRAEQDDDQCAKKRGSDGFGAICVRRGAPTLRSRLRGRESPQTT
jgi:hypothetical protein